MRRRRLRWIACLAAAWLATSCTIYRTKIVDAKALSVKAAKAKVVGVETAAGPVVFAKDEPAVVRDEAVVGNVYATYDLAAWDVADVSGGRSGAEVVLKDGNRFRVASSRTKGERVQCQTVKPVAVPLDEVVKAKLRVKDTAASILGSIGAAVFVVGVVALDAAINGNDDDTVDDIDDTIGLIDLFSDTGPGPGGGMPSNKAILEMKGSFDTSAEKEFWIMEWTPVEAVPGEDGKISLPVGNPTGVPRGVDEAKLVVVDHPSAVTVAPDGLGDVRAIVHPAPPDEAFEGTDRDIRELVAAKDGLLWRSTAEGSGPDKPVAARDEISLVFSRPKGARSARLIVSASTTSWRSDFAREARARHPNDAPSPYAEGEFSKLHVRMNTYFGWKTAQVIFVPGPLPSQDMVYGLDLGDVCSDKVEIRLSLPAGYWLIDHVAMDFGHEPRHAGIELAAEGTDDPDAAKVLEALAAEDGTTLRLVPGEAPATLAFTLPPRKEGMERSLFLRTVSCYETAGGAKRDGSKGGWS
jgi:hypothetical protein